MLSDHRFFYRMTLLLISLLLCSSLSNAQTLTEFCNEKLPNFLDKVRDDTKEKASKFFSKFTLDLAKERYKERYFESLEKNYNTLSEMGYDEELGRFFTSERAVWLVSFNQ